MLHIAIVFAAVVLLVPASWAEEPAGAPEAESAVTTTTERPERRAYGGRGGEPEGLPTGLPGFGSPGPPPDVHEKGKSVPPRPVGAP